MFHEDSWHSVAAEVFFNHLGEWLAVEVECGDGVDLGSFEDWLGGELVIEGV